MTRPTEREAQAATLFKISQRGYATIGDPDDWHKMPLEVRERALTVRDAAMMMYAPRWQPIEDFVDDGLMFLAADFGRPPAVVAGSRFNPTTRRIEAYMRGHKQTMPQWLKWWPTHFMRLSSPLLLQRSG
jgi:hypothetical protein